MSGNPERGRLIARGKALTALFFTATLFAADPSAADGPRTIELPLQTRDPNTDTVVVTPTRIDPSKTGIVVVDMWNYHWCKTATERVAAMVPRMERCLTEARQMGMKVFLCPTDAVDQYAGTPQREAVFAVPIRPIPALRKIECPSPPQGGGCACGREKCPGNYGWDAMHPGLSIHADDLMPNSLETLYWICKDAGIENLIFMGVHTQVCLLGKSVGLRNMKSAGFNCILARDLTDAHPDYDPARGLTPDGLTAATVAHFEKYLCPTINMYEEMKRLGRRQDEALADPVRLAPWGTPMRPHLFEEPITVLLSAPWQPNATIHYTTDGKEPTIGSTRYGGPFVIDKTTRLRAQAFETGRPVCTETVGYFAKLGPTPPTPDVHIGDLKPIRSVGPGHSPSDDSHRFSPNVNPPQKDRTNEGKELRLRGKTHERGMGVRAPNQMIFEVKPEYERFVALAGVDERILDVSNGTNLAMYPSVAFRVFIDGKLASESPVMRIAVEPWRFDVRIPEGAKIISLCATDAGDGNKQDLANWANAGFTLRKKAD